MLEWSQQIVGNALNRAKCTMAEIQEWERIKKKLVEGQKPTTNTRIVQILKEAKENELKILPWECMADTVKRYQDILNELYELVVQNQHNA